MEIEERNRLIVEAYLVKPISAVALEFGVSESLVSKLVADAKVKRKIRQPVHAFNAPDLGPLYVKLGGVLYYTRQKRAESTQIFADKMGWSAKKVVAIEKGKFQVTMLDLQDIAKISGLTLAELMNKIDKTGANNAD